MQPFERPGSGELPALPLRVLTLEHPFRPVVQALSMFPLGVGGLGLRHAANICRVGVWSEVSAAQAATAASHPPIRCFQLSYDFHEAMS